MGDRERNSVQNDIVSDVDTGTRRQEVLAFLVTTFVVFPGLAVGFVGAFGFAIWISQMILGPPGPPAG